MRTVVALAAAASMLFGQDGKGVLQRISVEGLEDLPAEAVARATGLVASQVVSPADFDRACGSLMDTGMFFTCQYKWAGNAKGVSVTFEVGEQEPDQALRIDIPGVDAKHLWEWARRNDPMLRPTMPSNSEASRYYVQALERYLIAQGRQEKIISKLESDIPSQTVVYVFRPEHLPRVTALRFVGNMSVAADKVVDALGRIALGNEYSEFHIRRLLALNVTPLFEQLGRLDVRYPKVEAQASGDGVAVVTTIEEGPVFHLSAAEVRIDGTPAPVPNAIVIGAVANWRDVRDAVNGMLKVQRNEGYLSAGARVTHVLDREKRTAVAKIDVERGVQWVFGTLAIKGLDAANVAKAMEHWELKAGAPMRERYPSDFIDRVFRLAQLGPTVRSAGARLEPRANTNVMDVVVTFR